MTNLLIAIQNTPAQPLPPGANPSIGQCLFNIWSYYLLLDGAVDANFNFLNQTDRGNLKILLMIRRSPLPLPLLRQLQQCIGMSDWGLLRLARIMERVASKHGASFIDLFFNRVTAPQILQRVPTRPNAHNHLNAFLQNLGNACGGSIIRILGYCDDNRGKISIAASIIIGVGFFAKNWLSTSNTPQPIAGTLTKGADQLANSAVRKL